MTETEQLCRLGARVTPDIYSLIRRAADLEGRTISDFIISASRDAAERTVEQAEVIRLGKDAAFAFAELMTEPGKVRIKLAEATPTHTQLLGTPE